MGFKAGQSGNPSGRPRGIKDKRTHARVMLESSYEQLLDKAVSLALDGNEQMLKLLLDRLLPAKPRDNPIHINLPANDLMKQQDHITAELNEGNISPTTALTLGRYVYEQSKIIEFAEIEKKLKEIEFAMRTGTRDEDFIEEEEIVP